MQENWCLGALTPLGEFIWHVARLRRPIGRWLTILGAIVTGISVINYRNNGQRHRFESAGTVQNNARGLGSKQNFLVCTPYL